MTNKKAALQDLLDSCERQGCRVVPGKNCHIKVFPPRGDMISVPSTPSDHRSMKDIVARLRRAGIVVGPR